MKIQQIAGIAALTALLTACTDATISQPETRTPPTAGAAFTGVGLGSGGRADTDSTETTVTSSDGTVGTASTADAGIGLGSGG